ncbi:hypothetical protein OQA88_5177 [Cercophora sp. LCS_1]
MSTTFFQEFFSPGGDEKPRAVSVLWHQSLPLGALRRLPAEVIEDVMDLVAEDDKTLRSLAQVNSGCRQIALAYKFRDLQLSNNPAVRSSIVELLAQEAIVLQNSDDQSANHRPFVGPCVRRLTVNCKHNGSQDLSLGPRRIDSRDHKRKRQEVSVWRKRIAAIMKHDMPNLRDLRWEHGFAFDEATAGAIFHLPLRHLELSGSHFRTFRLDTIAPATIPLETLKYRMTNLGGASATSTLLEGIIRRCSGTLLRLSLSPELGRPIPPVLLEPISLPLLRILDLGNMVTKLGVATWCGFLLNAPSLRQLVLPGLQNHPQATKAISRCQLHKLDTLILGGLVADENSTSALIGFIKKHPHLVTLYVHHAPPDVLDRELIPILADGRYTRLTRLSLSWYTEHESNREVKVSAISDASLALIGTIEPLTELSIGVHSMDLNPRVRSLWLVDHDTLLPSIRGLTRLKKLTLCQDTYRCPDDTAADGSPGKYYSLEAKDLDLRNRGFSPVARRRGMPLITWMTMFRPGLAVYQENTRSWEFLHLARMARLAKKYAAVLPQLEWICCGQRAMAIERSQKCVAIRPTIEGRHNHFGFSFRVSPRGQEVTLAE